MNAVFVTDVSIEKIIGGAERVLFEQSTRLAAKGHSVCLITRRLPGHRAERETVQGVEEIRCTFDPRGGLRSTIETWRLAREHLLRLHARRQIDCLNIHQPLTAFGLISQAAALGIPRVYTCHSLSAEEYLTRVTACSAFERLLRRAHAMARNWIEARVLRHCNRIVVLSRYTQEKLRRVHGIPTDRVEIVPGGVDLVRFHPATDKAEIRNRCGIPSTRFVLLTIRNLVSRMGLDHLVSAMQNVVRRVPQALLVIGGEGPLRDELQAQIGGLGLEGHVRMIGFIPEEALPGYYQMADLFVLPSRALEGFGMVTLEALACGLPVLGTSVGGTREILAGWDTNFLLNDARPETLAQGIIECHRRLDAVGARAAELSGRCREFAERRYSWDRNIAVLEAILAGDTPRPIHPISDAAVT